MILWYTNGCIHSCRIIKLLLAIFKYLLIDCAVKKTKKEFCIFMQNDCINGISYNK